MSPVLVTAIKQMNVETHPISLICVGLFLPEVLLA